MSDTKLNLDLTAFMIVKNEEIHLPRCLKSFEGLWKNLLIIDTGSTDSTKKIAKDFGAKILDFKWVDDFSAARNFALDKIKSEWIIWFDADDTIEKEDKESLFQEMKKSIPKYDLTLLSYIYFGNKQNPLLVHYFPRIWRTNKNLRYKRPIHESLDYREKNVSHQFLDIPYIHSKQISHKNSIERNIKMLSDFLIKNPGDQESIFYLGLEYKDAGELKKSNAYFQKFIDLKPSSHYRLYEAYFRIGINFIKMGFAKEAKTYFEKAIGVINTSIEPFLLLAEIEMNLFSIQKAITLLQYAKTLTPPKNEIASERKYYYGVADQLLEMAYRKLANQ